MKRQIALCTLLLALVSLISACGGEDKSSTAKKPQNSGAATGSEPVLKFEGPAREVTFPTDRVVGMLKSRPAGTTDWQNVGDARGGMKIPKDHEALLDLTNYNLSDITFLSAFKPGDLQELILEGCNLGDAALAPLSTVQLNGLNLNRNPFTDEGLKAIQPMNWLEKLSLGETAISDAGLAHLASLTKLQKIWLQNTAITDAGLIHLSGMTELWSLVLYDTAITDAGLDTLKALPNLRRLGLRGTKVTNAALAKLAEFPALEEVDLAATGVDQAEAVKVAEGHPKLRFIFDMAP